MDQLKEVFLILLALTIFLPSFTSATIHINEVMYNPDQCLDSHCEWIELYNPTNETINLSGCSLAEKEIAGQINPNSFFLLVKNQANFTHHFHLSENLLEASFSLKNSGEEITLTGNPNCSDNFDYTPYTDLANGNHHTLERNKQGQWKQSLTPGGTPGEQNSVHDFSYDYTPLKITEIMADPFGDDQAPKPLGEWIELYNSGSQTIHLGNLVLYDSQDDHELYLSHSNTATLTLCPGCYTIIYRNRDTDFDLSKTTDQVRLYTGYPLTEHLLIDQVSFSNSMEGMSWSLFDQEWFLSTPTPNSPNIYTSGCDWALLLETPNSIFQGSDLTFNLTLKRNYGYPENITVQGQIEDLFGFPIKTYSPWTNQQITSTRTKTYSPNLKEGVYQLSFQITSLNCQDQNPANNQLTSLIAINPQYKETASSLNIEKLYLGQDQKAEWGDQFNVKVNIYKGNTTKKSIQLWAEKDNQKISPITKLTAPAQYKHYPLTLPLQLDPNCHQKIKDGQAQLILSAFGLQTQQEFPIEGVDKTICKDYLAYVKDLEKEEAKRKKANAYQLLDLPVSASPGDVLRLKLQLIGDNLEHDFQTWSYLYRGSKCYSCANGKDRNHNLHRFHLNKDEIKQIELLVKIDPDLKEGEYRLKTKFLKDNQKTPKELTNSLYLQPKKTLTQSNTSLNLLSKAEENQETPLQNEKSLDSAPNFTLDPRKEQLLDQIKGVTVYESSSQKAKQLTPYLIITVLGLLSSILIFKKI